MAHMDETTTILLLFGLPAVGFVGLLVIFIYLVPRHRRRNDLYEPRHQRFNSQQANIWAEQRRRARK